MRPPFSPQISLISFSLNAHTHRARSSAASPSTPATSPPGCHLASHLPTPSSILLETTHFSGNHSQSRDWSPSPGDGKAPLVDSLSLTPPLSSPSSPVTQLLPRPPPSTTHKNSSGGAPFPDESSRRLPPTLSRPISFLTQPNPHLFGISSIGDNESAAFSLRSGLTPPHTAPSPFSATAETPPPSSALKTSSTAPASLLPPESDGGNRPTATTDRLISLPDSPPSLSSNRSDATAATLFLSLSGFDGCQTTADVDSDLTQTDGPTTKNHRLRRRGS